MVWQEHAELIVMLTNFKEGGKVKCDAYWPQEIEEKYLFDDD